MLKFFGAVLLIVASTTFGFWFSSVVRNRENFLKSFVVFLNTLKTYMRFNSGNICELILHSAEQENLALLKQEFKADKTGDFHEKWRSFLEAIPYAAGLNKTDKELLSDFFSGLGVTDLDGQLAHIDLYIELFKRNREKSSEDCNKKIKLYRLLGFFSGAAVTLMII